MGKINNISNNILTKFVTRRNNNPLDEKKNKSCLGLKSKDGKKG